MQKETGDIDRRIAKEIFGWNGTDILHDPAFSESDTACCRLKAALRGAGIEFVVFHKETGFMAIPHADIVSHGGGVRIQMHYAMASAAQSEPEAVARFAVALLDAGILKPKVAA